MIFLVIGLIMVVVLFGVGALLMYDNTELNNIIVGCITLLYVTVTLAFIVFGVIRAIGGS